MNQLPPLYKYMPFQAPSLFDNGSTEEKRQTKRRICFENGEIWYPKVNKLNDPYDCKPDFDINFSISDEDKLEGVVNSLTDSELRIVEMKTGIASKEDLLRILKEPYVSRFTKVTIKKHGPSFMHRAAFIGSLSAVFSASLSRIGVLSLSEDPFNLRMWALYGGNSSGICLEFQRKNNNTLGSESTKIVNYVRERPKIMLQRRHESLIEIITTKSHIWEYEKEWRDLKPEGGKSYQFPGKVQKVIFGLNCHKETIELIKNIFGSEVKYEEISLGTDYSLRTDCGLKHSISQIQLKW